LNICKSFRHSCLIGLIKYSNGAFNYILIPQGIKYGSFILNKTSIFIKFLNLTVGTTTFLIYFSVLSIVFNLVFNLKKGGQYARAAGTFCQILEINKEKNLILIEFPTKIKKWVVGSKIATLGRASNIFHNQEIFGKAGYFRNLNVRPTTRGVAMNPVDHPHGGRTKTSSPEVTPWGRVAKRNK